MERAKWVLAGAVFFAPMVFLIVTTFIYAARY